MAELHAQVSGRTVEITSNLYPLKMAVVPRDCKGLGDEWESAGIYVLLGEPDGSTWRVYVGQAKELRKRIRQHRKSAEAGTFFAWNRALLVCNTGSTGSFGLSEIGWLEWRMYGLLEADGVDLENKQAPGEVPLGAASQANLEIFVGVIKDALVLLGYDPAGRQQQVSARTAELEPEETTPATIGKVHLKLLGVVKSGTQIESTSRQHPATATVEPRGIRYQDELFGSPSAAAKAVTEQDTADGWSFWGVRSGSGKVVMLKDLRAQRETGGIAAAVTDTAQDLQPTGHDARPKVVRRPSRGRTTPKKMPAATVRRILARRDDGATYVQLRKEFGLTQGSVYTLLLENGRVTQR